LSDEAPPETGVTEKDRIIRYLRKEARVWLADGVRRLHVTAGDIGRQLDLIATELEIGMHKPSEDRDSSDD
jgi:hypothetical protein